jgi:hypothetical protein
VSRKAVASYKHLVVNNLELANVRRLCELDI